MGCEVNASGTGIAPTAHLSSDLIMHHTLLIPDETRSRMVGYLAALCTWDEVMRQNGLRL